MSTTLDNVKPGDTVRVSIVKPPTNAAARKTLVRLLSKDPDVRRENQRHRAVRDSNYAPKRRGGRLYGGRLTKQHPLDGRVGETGTIRATVDALRDLRSVQRFVQLEPA